jgi:uncharacterized protein YdeI (YjbR/CyaY-like superfamily)
MEKQEPPVLNFQTPDQWEDWLSKNYTLEVGVWLRFFKKASGVKTMTYDEALDLALCYGWIDGVAKGYDEQSWLQKYTPRRKRSIWSKRNTERVERLIKEGKMREPGLKQIELAKADGRWERAYEGQSKMTVPEDFLNELKKSKKAYEFFQTLNKTNTYAIAWRLHTAKKPETREKRMKSILEMLSLGKKFH